MVKERVLEAIGMTMIGEGILALVHPRGHTMLWLRGPRAWRAKCRPPSFINYQVVAKMLEGHMLADTVAIIGSLNIVAAELDR